MNGVCQLQTEPQTGKRALNSRRLLLYAVIAIVALLVLSAGFLTGQVLASHKIRTGVFIDETYVGGLTREQAVEKLSGDIVTDGRLSLVCGEARKEFAVEEIDAQLSIEDSVNQAYEVARTGNIFRRIYDYVAVRINNVHIPLTVTYNQETLVSYIAEVASQVDQPQKEREIQLEGDVLLVKRGHSGRRIIPAHAEETVAQAIRTQSYGDVTLELETVDPKPIDVDSIYEEACGAPVDATYEVKNHRLTIVPEKPGIEFDKAEAADIIKQSEGDVIRIPVSVTAASKTAADVEASLFTDRLAKYATNYNQGSTNRSYNIYLACKNINGTVLAPGDVFSYNEIVGPRTAARGFKDAGVYVGNKVEQGIGGGICQVSSTLFNTAVLSDLEIVYRTNHSMPVSYVPRGRDATVSYGEIDFKFSNNTSSPIKVVASAGGGVCSISIYGVKEDKSKTIDFATQQTGTTPFRTEKKEDPTLPEGETKIEQKGSNGSSYNTYKITKVNGKEVKRELLTRSTYVPVEQIELVGTMKIEATPEPVATAPASAPPAEPPSVEEIEAGDAPVPSKSPAAPPVPVAPAA